MASRSLVVRLTANTDAYTAGLRKGQAETKAFSTGIGRNLTAMASQAISSSPAVRRAGRKGSSVESGRRLPRGDPTPPLNR